MQTLGLLGCLRSAAVAGLGHRLGRDARFHANQSGMLVRRSGAVGCCAAASSRGERDGGFGASLMTGG
jgi:hypothetical protein